MPDTALAWLRNDLRMGDNPALSAAVETGLPVIALFIHETDASLRPIGAAARWWLDASLGHLREALDRLGIALEIQEGEAAQTIEAAVRRHGARAVFWNRRYAAAERDIDAAIKSRLVRAGCECRSFAGNVLAEPWDVTTGGDTPYSVYTPFWKALQRHEIRPPVPRPKRAASGIVRTVSIDRYRAPRWAWKLNAYWQVGEVAAQQVLERFLDERLAGYPEGRDYPGREVTSRLSPSLRFGEISARQIWHAAQLHAHRHPAAGDAIMKFLSELAWRDFNYHQLYHRQDIATVAMQPKRAAVPWRDDPGGLVRWQGGATGIPIVDAGMRELWETGYMHNRVRMVVASLLVKNLLIDWRLGEQWFWDCLVDADAANNPGNWQWVAGCGLDASPYFRIFNPVTQGERFDADGAYVRRWVPELHSVPDKWVHRPWEMSPSMLEASGVVLGDNYPQPIVDLKASRQRALDALG